MRQAVRTFVFLLIVPSCGGQAVETTASSSLAEPAVPAPGQRYLFEMTRENFAWGATLKGAYVTADGNVYRYDYYGSNAQAGCCPFHDAVPGMTEQQVTEKYGSGPQLVATVDRATLLAKYALVGPSRGGMLLRQSFCADYGQERAVAWIYDSTAARYTPVVLAAEGDTAVRNTAPEADALAAWMRSLVGDTMTGACAFRTKRCAGQPCPGAPACSTVTVPVSDNAAGCLESCNVAEWCESVADCSACALGQQACLIDQQGGKHCAKWYPGCQQGVSCDCAGDNLCAAGAAACRGTPETGLRCVAP
jgi:hypothetical protein